MSLRKMAEEYAEDEVTRAKCCEHCRERAIERKIHLIPAYLAGAREALEMAAALCLARWQKETMPEKAGVAGSLHDAIHSLLSQGGGTGCARKQAELEARLAVAEVALEHIASDKPKCAGCTLADISLVEHYTHEARTALAKLRGEKQL